jgi:hypothetical protein
LTMTWSSSARGRLSYRFRTLPGRTGRIFRALSEDEGWTWNWNRRATQAQINSVVTAPSLRDNPRRICHGGG